MAWSRIRANAVRISAADARGAIRARRVRVDAAGMEGWSGEKNGVKSKHLTFGSRLVETASEDPCRDNSA
jgi:hypothetical protein